MTLRKVSRIQCDVHPKSKGPPIIGHLDEYGADTTNGETTIWYEFTMRDTRESNGTTIHVCNECKRRLTGDKP